MDRRTLLLVANACHPRMSRDERRRLLLRTGVGRVPPDPGPEVAMAWLNAWEPFHADVGPPPAAPWSRLLIAVLFTLVLLVVLVAPG